MVTETDEWPYINEFLQSVLKKVEADLDQESIEFVHHYLKHDEYEMAFEGLFLELMKQPKAPVIDLAESKRMAVLLNLNTESVFDVHFWLKFQRYLEQNNGK